MLLQAVAEKYGSALGDGITATSLIKEFLGSDPSSDKLQRGDAGNVDLRGALDIDTSVEVRGAHTWW